MTSDLSFHTLYKTDPVTSSDEASDSRLHISGPDSATSDLLVANGNNSFQVGLPTGVYRISAEGIPGAEPARLAVGPFRASSQNDVLLP